MTKIGRSKRARWKISFFTLRQRPAGSRARRLDHPRLTGELFPCDHCGGGGPSDFPNEWSVAVRAGERLQPLGEKSCPGSARRLFPDSRMACGHRNLLTARSENWEVERLPSDKGRPAPTRARVLHWPECWSGIILQTSGACRTPARPETRP